jgi:hypothetical protein
MDPRMRQDTIVPPAPETDPELPTLVEFDPDCPLWRAIEQTAVETWRPTGEER